MVVDWVGDGFDCRPTSGYCTAVYGFLVTWVSKRESVKARSGVEAEFRIILQGVSEVI